MRCYSLNRVYGLKQNRLTFRGNDCILLVLLLLLSARNDTSSRWRIVQAILCIGCASNSRMRYGNTYVAVRWNSLDNSH